MAFLIGGANSADTGYDVANSLRFDDGSSDYLNRTLGTPQVKEYLLFQLGLKEGN
jgi:hypothetical protein